MELFCRVQDGVIEGVSGVVHKEVAAMAEIQAKAAHKNSDQERKV